jgi:pimeloyl-ACP methyl ester carboxylesterase
MTTGQPNRAELVGRYAWAAGGRDPGWSPRTPAGSPRPPAPTVSPRPGTSATRRSCTAADGWTELRAVRNRIAGQLARRQFRPSGKADRNGNLARRASSDESARFLGSTSHGRGDAEGAVPPDRGETMHSTVRSFRTPDGVKLGVEHFGDAAAPLVLLAGGPTMLSWPDALCETLALGGRHVVRYDLRDAGASTTVDPEAPAYTLRDLAADAAALARGLDDRPAHLAGIGVGGMVVQVAALDHPGAFSTLTLAGTRPVAPGRVDDDLPDHDAATMKRRFALPMPDWSDRAAVAEFAAARAVILGDDPAAARATAERIFDRTPGTEPAVQMANQMGMVFSKLNCEPRWRERLPELAMPALVVHGRRDTFFPVGNGEALAREIPGARLLVLEQAATALPDAAADEVAAAMLALQAVRG